MLQSTDCFNLFVMRSGPLTSVFLRVVQSRDLQPPGLENAPIPGLQSLCHCHMQELLCDLHVAFAQSRDLPVQSQNPWLDNDPGITFCYPKTQGTVPIVFDLDFLATEAMLLLIYQSVATGLAHLSSIGDHVSWIYLYFHYILVSFGDRVYFGTY